TSSTIASTCRSLAPVAITNTSVMASRSLTSMSTMSVASLSLAACAASCASSIAASVAVMRRTRERARRQRSAFVGYSRRSSLRGAAVQVVLVDVLDHPVGNEVPDGVAGLDAAAAVAGGDRHRRDVQ